jgi:hypothetical protein
MNQSFEINFDFALAPSDMTVSLTATAELHHSIPYYVVDHFHFAGVEPEEGQLSFLPPQEIRQITRGDAKIWVHKDSERESILSRAMGKAIEAAWKRSGKKP